MARTKDKLPRWAEILLGTLIVGGLIWALVPREILYLSIGIAVAIIGAASYLILRRQGTQPFKNLLARFFNWLRGESRKEMVASLPSHDANKLKLAVGYKCENENCPRTRNLDVHHITPKTEEGSSHRLSNLLVLCKNCHGDADRGEPNREIQKLMARKPNRFPQSKYHLVRNWRYER